VRPDWAVANETQRLRLHAVAGRLGPDDLQRRLTNGNTIAEELVHLAFWDTYALTVVEQFQAGTYEGLATNFEAVNAGVLALAARIPIEQAGALALKAADTIDDKAVSLDPETIKAIVDASRERIFERYHHRAVHLDQIEAALGR
jgi:hypothetical protein